MADNSTRRCRTLGAALEILSAEGIEPLIFMRVADWIASPSNRRGLIFDLMMFLTGLFLVGPLTRLVLQLGESFTNDANDGPALGLLLAAVFVSHTLGAYLKRWPLQARLVKRPALDENSFAGCVSRLGSFLVVIFHFVLFLVMTIMIVVDYEMTEFRGSIFLIMGVACLPTAMTIRALIPPKGLSAGTWRTSWGVEMVADLALFFSTLVLLVIWNLVSESVLTALPFNSPGDLAGNVVAMVLFVIPMFAMFYIAPRVLYLAEDFMYPGTWLSIVLAILPSAKRVMFGG
jgi:hypothetical protein